jgi:hypothetical protein
LTDQIGRDPRVRTAYYLLNRPSVDCHGLTGLSEHLDAVAVALDGPWTESFLAADGAHLMGVRQVSHWLHLAAGLRHVEIFLMNDVNNSDFCSWDYPLDLNHLASIYITEFTRLQYTSNAIERLLELADYDLPRVGRAGRVKRAMLALKNYWNEQKPPEHYHCLVRHLRSHIMNYPKFKRVGELVNAFECTAWRDSSGLLLAAGIQLWQLPAHGNIIIPDPEYADFSRGDSAYPKIAHIPIIGVRALLINLQMLVIALGWAADQKSENSWKRLHLRDQQESC